MGDISTVSSSEFQEEMGAIRNISIDELSYIRSALFSLNLSDEEKREMRESLFSNSQREK